MNIDNIIFSKMSIHKLIFHVALCGIVFCISGFISSCAHKIDMADDIKNYKCDVEQYSAINYETNMCMIKSRTYKRHAQCFYITVKNLCEKKEKYDDEK